MTKAKRPHYLGVNWHEARKTYKLRIHTDGHTHSFGYYKNPVFAAKLYDALVKELRGTDAVLNFDGVLPTGVTRNDIWEMLREKGLKK